MPPTSCHDHHPYEVEMSTALECWANRIESLLPAEGVARLR
jgi:hypothetical protein